MRMALSLPDEVWKMVLGYVDPAEYQTLTTKDCGVSREFYWMLKNSVRCLHLSSPPHALLSLVWMRTREEFCAPVKCVTVTFPILDEEVRTLLESPGFHRLRLLRIVLPPRYPQPSWIFIRLATWTPKALEEDLLRNGIVLPLQVEECE